MKPVYMEATTIMASVNALADEYRQTCLWFLGEDMHAETPAQALRILRYIEQRGDVAALRKVAPLKQWLLQHTSVPSAV